MKNILTSILLVLSVCAFAQRITDLPAVTTPLTGAEFLAAVQSGTTKKLTAQNIADLVTRTSLSVNNVDNTSDVNKPISTATQTALSGKVATTVTVNGHALSSNVTVTKADVGLSAADNTSDLGKPVSTLQAAADAATLVSANAYTDSQLAVVATEAINGAITLDDTDFGKLHTLTDIGSPADYTVTVPTPSGSNTGKTIYFKGLSTLTKVVTLSNGAITFSGYANLKLSRDGLYGLLSEGTNYRVVAEVGSWIPFTPGFTGFSVNPTSLDASWFRIGRKLTVRFKATTSGTSNANTFTITGLPFAARNDQYFIILVQDGGVNKAGLLYTGASSTTLGLQPLPATTAWSTTLAKNAWFTIDIEL